MKTAIQIGFSILKNYGDDNPSSRMVKDISDEFLSTAIAHLEQGQEEYIMGVFPGVPPMMIEAGRDMALKRLQQCIGGM
jgi:hypothetical protein